VRGFTAALTPATPLARVQEVWERTAGPVLAQAAQRAGTVTILCSSAVWAQELSLMETELLDRLNSALGEELLCALRCRAG
jgi:predicted nucleic acid-binding Zn ribbon protein